MNDFSKLVPLRPEPLMAEMEVLEYAGHIAPELAVNELLAGNYVLVVDTYASGLAVLETLKKRLFKPRDEQAYSAQRAARNQFRDASHRLLLEIENNQLTVRKAPQIGWLKELYTTKDSFFLSFPEVQGLNSGWQWYDKGLKVPGLNYKIRPYYGTYLPTRFEHIECFDDYLSNYTGAKENALDIGVGTGILSFLMQKHQFKKVAGTDINPNAIIGLDKLQATFKTAPKIDLRFGAFAADLEEKFDLIVFNPPWIPNKKTGSGIDNAMYYNEDLFPTLFDSIGKSLSPKGTLVLIFSNLAGLTDKQFEHPIELELADHSRFHLVEKITRPVGMGSDKTKRSKQYRSQEEIELWVLKVKHKK